MKSKAHKTKDKNKLIHFDKYILIDKETGMLYDKKTLKLIGNYNY